MTNRFTRRRFVANASALGASSLLGLPRLAAAEPPPETRKVRLFVGPVTCLAPQYVARELLYAEGFGEVQYVTFPNDTQHWPPDDLIAGDVDLTVSFTPLTSLR
jgi:NitT/TauT family transport system substrate-binding protein